MTRLRHAEGGGGHLDVRCVEVPQGGQRSRKTVRAAVYPHGLEYAGGHTCLLTEAL